jgi:hypothetical protein
VAAITHNSATSYEPDRTLLTGLAKTDGAEKWTKQLIGGGGTVASRPGEIVIVGTTRFGVDAGSGFVPVHLAGNRYLFVARYAEDGTHKSLAYTEVDSYGSPVFTATGDIFVNALDCKLPPLPDGSNEAPTALGALAKFGPSAELSWMGMGRFGTGPIAVSPDSVVLATFKVDSTDLALFTFPR